MRPLDRSGCAANAALVSASSTVCPRYPLPTSLRPLQVGGRALLIIHDGVYDVTHFIDSHPGGSSVRARRMRVRGTAAQRADTVACHT